MTGPFNTAYRHLGIHMKIAGLESLRKQRRIGKIDSSQSFDSACLVETVDANNETDSSNDSKGIY